MKKTIFVIGTGSGLGNGVAEKFASCGFKVVFFPEANPILMNMQLTLSKKDLT